MTIRNVHRFGLAASAAFFLTQCKTPNHEAKVKDDSEAEAPFETEAAGGAAGAGILSLPTLSDEAGLLPMVTAAVKKTDAPAAKQAEYAKKIAHYLAFLGLKGGDGNAKVTLARILESSTQFILCPDVTDWGCLEQKPWITPSIPSRVDTADDLGTPVVVNEPLKLTFFFTNQWDVATAKLDKPKLLVNQLAQRIVEDGKDGIDLAIYGIDKATGSMKPVYDALIAKIGEGVPVRGVFDVNGITRKAKAGPYVFSMLPLKSSNGKGIFDKFDDKTTNLEFQYKDTPNLIQAMNAKAKTDEQAMGRVEWPGDSLIMHNKFIVLKNGNKMSVWTGTANVADTCMGSERNSNMSLFIENDEVAKVFEDEFTEMWTYMDQPFPGKGKVVNAKGEDGITVGHFHTNKTANTKRYFKFKDGIEAAIHFAPTDDGEHRSVIPALLSARPGDEVRVSMFGGSGLEFVRIFQYLQSKGTNIRIVTDNLTGSGKRGWLRDPCGNVLDKNPFAASPKGTLVVRRSAKMKQNHHKIGSITRKTAGGMVPEIVIIGSQNWTAPGNDGNDENMVSLRHVGTPLAAAAGFNEHFDTRVWVVSAANEMKPGTSYAAQLGKPADTTVCDASASDEDTGGDTGDGS